jgi:uncharacterized protein (DUF433 family)
MSQTYVEHIQLQPEVCGGKPGIAGTRIRVQDIYHWHELQGLSADEITSRFPQLQMADVYAALAYFWDHHNEMQQQMAAETAFVDAMKRDSISPLKQKLSGSDAKNNPVSS